MVEGGGSVVIVTCSGEGAIAMLAEAVRARGLTPALITGPIGAELAAQLGRLVDGIVSIADPRDPAALATAARELADGTPAAVVSWHDATIVAAAQAAQLLGVDRAPAAGIARACNKHVARRVLAAAGVSVPRFALIGGEAQAEAVAAGVGFPAIVKPVNGAGSMLVRRVDSVSELASAYRQLAAQMPSAAGGVYAHLVADADGAAVDPARTFLVEGMLRGREYCADVIVRAGAVEHVLLLDKFLVDDDYFERGFAWPPLDLPEERAALIRRAVDDAIAALGLRNTTAHIELIDDVTLGPAVVEVNAGRTGGQILGLLASVATGVDVRAEHVALATGAPPPPRGRPRLPPPLATLSYFPEGSGRVVALHGLDDVTLHPAVIAVVPLCQPGDVLDDEIETFAINVLVYGLETRRELVQAYDEIARLVSVELEPVEALSGRQAGP
jgi:predicted ATP-grasp superfamily ATP-dependent carboligase